MNKIIIKIIKIKQNKNQRYILLKLNNIKMISKLNNLHKSQIKISFLLE